jgi:hypothetical protein
MENTAARMEVDIPYLQPHSECKVCGENALLYGVVDFTKSCEESQHRLKLQPVGMPIYYYQCNECRFLFTKAFDKWTLDDFKRYIYNENYQLFDPEYVEVRPHFFAQGMHAMLTEHRGAIHGLDYGGGSGLLASLMRERGYDYSSWDPIDATETVPEGKFNFISAIEVAEHVPDPHAFFSAIDRFLSHDGVCFFTTLATECAESEDLMRWWYVAPINGHISIYSHESLKHLAAQYGLFAYLGDHKQLLYRTESALLDACVARFFPDGKPR